MKIARYYHSRVSLYGDGPGFSTQEHKIYSSTPLMVDFDGDTVENLECFTGIVQHICFHAPAPRGEAVEPPFGCGGYDDERPGIAEWSFAYRGRWYATFDEAIDAFEADSYPAIEERDP